MYLKRLELVGFKSFAGRTALDLDPGIVVFVGPNGSGKSNLADAIRWVLGEQSMRAVRSKRSEDVIFAGSASRQPLGMAEVSLYLDNSDERLPLPYAEVRVTRRLYRSGESEYLLNGSRVRLKDIVEVLTHAGLGAESYCVIGQGAVEELILQRPEERRLAFESAADIRRHQVKLAETRSRLESTEQNLTRCQDVMAELEPHLRRLRTQAERAERAQRVRQELSTLARQWFRRRLHEVEQTLAEAERDHRTADGNRSRLESALVEQEAAWQRARESAEALAGRMRELRPRVEALRVEHERLQREAAVAEERVAQFERRLDVEGPETRGLRERVAGLQAEWTAARQAQQAIEATLATQRQGAAAARERLRDGEQELARRQQALATLEQAHGRQLVQRAALERQRTAAEVRAEAVQREAAESVPARLEAEQAVRELQSRLALERERGQDLEHRLQEVFAQRARGRQEQSALGERVTQLQQAALAAEREAARLEAVISQLAPSPPGGGEASGLPTSVRETGATLLGLLGERLYVPAAYEAALAAALGGLARALLVKDTVELERLAETLLRERGRWTLLALESKNGAEAQSFQRLARSCLTGCHFHGFGNELFESPSELAPLVSACLGRTIVVADADLIEAHRRLASERALPGPWQVVGVSGTCARSSGEWLVGMGGAVDPLLSRERERRRLSVELAATRERLCRVESDLAQAVQAREQAGKQASELAAAVAGLEADVRQSRALVHDLERQLGRREEDQRRAQERLNAAQRAQEQLARDEAARGAAELRCAQDLEALGRQLAPARTVVQEQEVQLARLRGELATDQTQVAVSEAQLRSAMDATARLASEAGQAQQALDRAVGAQTRAQEERRAQEQVLAACRTQLESVGAQLLPLRELLAECEAESQQQAEARRGVEDALGLLRQDVRSAQEAHEAASLARERARAERERLRREAAEALMLSDEDESDDWPTQLQLALEGPDDQPKDVQEPVVDMLAARRRLNTLQRELRSIGEVSEGTLEEYHELAERHAFLSTQSKDLLTTMVELRRAIGDLEALMTERFASTFERVNTAFQETFTALFGGGAAQLVLTRPENLLETGVEVVARPPGKRLQGLMSLSGGERALTSVALLFALLRVNPTPFVLLDEVDAALDESNVQRFADLLKGSAKDIQFIVVTHNRATMEMGSALFGVSMETGGVSKVLSLRLPEAAGSRS